MKRTLPLSLLVAFALPVAGQTVLINENFDGFAVGADITTVSPNFTVWPGGGGAPVSTLYAHSGANSVEWISTDAANGGPGDVLLLLGDQTSGVFTLSWWMYVPVGFGGYFNVQHAEDVSTPSFAAEVIFEDGGNISGTANNAPIAGTYPQDTWFQVALVFDLNSIQATFSVDLAPITSWQFDTNTAGAAAPNQLGAIDFYAFGGGAPTLGTYYIDDLLYVDLNVGVPEIGAAQLSTYPNPATDHLYVEIPNSGGTPEVILSDVSGRVVTQSRSFATAGDALRLELDMSALPAGVYTLRMNDGNTSITRKVIKS